MCFTYSPANDYLIVECQLGGGGTRLQSQHSRIQRQADFWGQPGLQIEFQDSQGYTEKPCLEKKPNPKNQTNKQTKKF